MLQLIANRWFSAISLLFLHVTYYFTITRVQIFTEQMNGRGNVMPLLGSHLDLFSRFKYSLLSCSDFKTLFGERASHNTQHISTRLLCVRH